MIKVEKGEAALEGTFTELLSELISAYIGLRDNAVKIGIAPNNDVFDAAFIVSIKNKTVSDICERAALTINKGGG